MAMTHATPFLRILPAASRPRTPWHNGLGYTREIVRCPVGSGFEDFDWRLAIADLEADAPFSRLEEIDRVLAVIEGDPVELTVAGEPRRLERHVPTAFPGDADASARLLSGPARDLNVMTRRGRATATMEILDRVRSLRIPHDPDGIVVAVMLHGCALLRVGEEHGEALSTHDAVIARGAHDARLETGNGGMTIALIRIGAAAEDAAA